MITLIEDLKKLAKHKSSIKPPSLISSPFQRRKVINPTPPPPPRRLRHGSTVVTVERTQTGPPTLSTLENKL